MGRFKAIRYTKATLLLMALPVVGEEKSIMDGAEVICSLGECEDSW